MRIKRKNGIWYAKSTYEERHDLKAGGWWFHGGNCPADCLACRAEIGLLHWWTPHIATASVFADYADHTCREELQIYRKRREERCG